MSHGNPIPPLIPADKVPGNCNKKRPRTEQARQTECLSGLRNWFLQVRGPGPGIPVTQAAAGGGGSSPRSLPPPRACCSPGRAPEPVAGRRGGGPGRGRRRSRWESPRLGKGPRPKELGGSPGSPARSSHVLRGGGCRQALSGVPEEDPGGGGAHSVSPPQLCRGAGGARALGCWIRGAAAGAGRAPARGGGEPDLAGWSRELRAKRRGPAWAPRAPSRGPTSGERRCVARLPRGGAGGGGRFLIWGRFGWGGSCLSLEGKNGLLAKGKIPAGGPSQAAGSRSRWLLGLVLACVYFPAGGRGGLGCNLCLIFNRFLFSLPPPPIFFFCRVGGSEAGFLDCQVLEWPGPAFQEHPKLPRIPAKFAICQLEPDLTSAQPSLWEVLYTHLRKDSLCPGALAG
ncbi:translation initiation factor IF-2-like [Chelonia mydas]|uniref:translation initiation factor IF-2-like n=1 Tax=Chelonia mydas TaxID=8469 RepID=UPI001CA8F5E9|nr:translation initiation factor IF-2-like [Chelonia mydas]